jgi:hypothetical protein
VWALCETAFCAVLQRPCGRVLCVHRSGSVHTPTVAGLTGGSPDRGATRARDQSGAGAQTDPAGIVHAPAPRLSADRPRRMARTRSSGVLGAPYRRWRRAAPPRVRAMTVIVPLEIEELPVQISGRPEEHAIETFAPNGANQAFFDMEQTWNVARTGLEQRRVPRTLSRRLRDGVPHSRGQRVVPPRARHV